MKPPVRYSHFTPSDFLQNVTVTVLLRFKGILIIINQPLINMCKIILKNVIIITIINYSLYRRTVRKQYNGMNILVVVGDKYIKKLQVWPLRDARQNWISKVITPITLLSFSLQVRCIHAYIVHLSPYLLIFRYGSHGEPSRKPYECQSKRCQLDLFYWPQEPQMATTEKKSLFVNKHYSFSYPFS